MELPAAVPGYRSGDSDSGGDVTMTTQAEDLLGARLIGADGKVVGTVEQVFRDDVDGTPAWAKVRAGKTGRFVPLGNSQVTRDGLSVPFDSQKIMSGPEIDAERHMSAAQAEELSQYYGLTVPAQTGRQEQQQQGIRQQQGMQQQQQGMQQQGMRQQQQQDLRGQQPDEGWLTRSEERFDIGTEMLETGRVRLHKYVDSEPVEQAVHVYHEEYDVERIPITAEERARGVIEEGEMEVILHEERAVLRKEAVPVERVRLVTKRVDESRTVRDELRRERIEIEPDQQLAGIGPGGGQRSQRSR
jgi:uncharacterized protein (TIGR02271 family)